MKANRDALIIHSFALLHAGVALGSRLIGIADDLMLTMLTMLLVVIICMRRGMGVKFMAASVIAVNIIGFALGRGIAIAIGLVTSVDLLANPLSTFLTTEFLGWGIYACAEWVRRRSGFQETDTAGLRWLLIAFVVIMCTRLAIILMFSNTLDRENIALNVVVDYAFSCIVLVFLAEYALRISARAQLEQEKAHLAQYRYLKLREQVNPHFLFNSLNILDCLVTEEKTDQASTYIHKLAGIYRYMIKNEEERLVSLRDEMDFVGQYVGLLQVRFPEGLEVGIDIPEEALRRKVVPCSVQLLIENATKHNSITPQSPLKIAISFDGDRVRVVNNLQPKMTSAPSTGLGLKYLQEQYQDVAGAAVNIQKTETEYKVEIPII